jgi:hypothetical protein
MPWVLKMTTDDARCSKEKNLSINGSQQHDLTMANGAPSKALKQTHLNQDHVSVLLCELHGSFLKLQHEKVKASIDKKDLKDINARLWKRATNFQGFTSVVAKAKTAVGEMGKVSSKLMHCWAFEALENNLVSKAEQAVIFSNLVKLPDVNSITGKEPDPVEKDPIVARTRQDGARPDAERLSLCSACKQT